MLAIDSEWLERLACFDKLWIGLSGGLDSTVLLHYLASNPQFTGRLGAIHVHHGLSPNADAWLAHCQQLCKNFGVSFSAHQIKIDQRANIEEVARDARYQVFSSVVQAQDCLLLAHHADDQAETVLLQLFRGAGVDGLAGMSAYKPFALGHLFRPFLAYPRSELEAYALAHQLSWVEDESNQDSSFSRNFLRHQVMPLLQKKWPGVGANLVTCARHCQQAMSNLNSLAQLDNSSLVFQCPMLDLDPIQGLSRERIANVLRFWIKKNQVNLPSTETFYRLIDEVILAKVDAKPSVHWGRVVVKRYRRTLYLLTNKPMIPNTETVWSNFPAEFKLDHEHTYLQANIVKNGLYVPKNSRLCIRFRQGGELFSWHGQTKTLKKLFQQWDVPPWQRDTIPLLYIDGHLAAVIGYAISDQYSGYGVDKLVDPMRIFEIAMREVR